MQQRKWNSRHPQTPLEEIVAKVAGDPVTLEALNPQNVGANGNLTSYIIRACEDAGGEKRLSTNQEAAQRRKNI